MVSSSEAHASVGVDRRRLAAGVRRQGRCDLQVLRGPQTNRYLSALEVFLNDMRYINPRFTYLLTYLSVAGVSSRLRVSRPAVADRAAAAGARERWSVSQRTGSTWRSRRILQYCVSECGSGKLCLLIYLLM